MATESTDNRENFIRILTWGGFGITQGLRGNELAKLTLVGLFVEHITGLKLEDIIISQLKNEYNRNHLQQSPNNSLPVIPEIESSFSIDPKDKSVSVPKSSQYSDIARDSKWLEVIPHPSVIVTLGRRGSGKTATAHRILELAKFRSLPFVLGMHQQALKDLPEWLGVITNPDEAPENSTLLIDETHLRFNARDSQKQMSREISRIINLSRQKRQTLIFINQQARTIDKNIVSTADVLIIKEPEPLQVKFERREINETIKVATGKFQNIKQGDRAKWSLVYSPACHFFDMLTNDLPSYWTDQLSRSYAFPSPSIIKKPARKMGKVDKIRQTKLLKNMGLQVTQIMREIGVRSRTTVYKYLATPDGGVQPD